LDVRITRVMVEKVLLIFCHDIAYFWILQNAIDTLHVLLPSEISDSTYKSYQKTVLTCFLFWVPREDNYFIRRII